ncbi:MAG: hypothetical protein L3J06_06085 [Cyclobacteriaceae bacterium]|nr:hypothetical protein [Cyclobacteriaceae bacterium]
MKTKHIVFPLLIIMMFVFGSPKAQCFRGVEYSVIQSQGTIELKFDADYDFVIVNLENARLKGNSVFENSIRIENVSRGRKYIVFKNLPSSKYLIQLATEDCKWVIGGIEGIIIKDKDEK